MLKYKIILVIIVFALISFGCSDKQKEADKLEQQLTESGETITPFEETVVDSAAIASEPVVEQPVEEAPVEPEISYQPEGFGYTIQVAGCEDESYANYLVELYTKRNYEPYMVTAVVEDVTYYRVRLGMFETLGEAKAFLSDLNDAYSTAGWIDKVGE